MFLRVHLLLHISIFKYCVCYLRRTSFRLEFQGGLLPSRPLEVSLRLATYYYSWEDFPLQYLRLNDSSKLVRIAPLCLVVDFSYNNARNFGLLAILWCPRMLRREGVSALCAKSWLSSCSTISTANSRPSTKIIDAPTLRKEPKLNIHFTIHFVLSEKCLYVSLFFCVPRREFWNIFHISGFGGIRIWLFYVFDDFHQHLVLVH